MQAALSALIDDLAASDVSTWTDAAIEAEFLELRRNQDRLDAISARLLAGVRDRLIPSAVGASSASIWAQSKAGCRATEAAALLAAADACEHMPLLAKAWREGLVSSASARAIGRGIKVGHEELYRSLEPQMVELATDRRVRDLDNVIRYYRRCADEIDDIARGPERSVFG